MEFASKDFLWIADHPELAWWPGIFFIQNRRLGTKNFISNNA
jgi:hypothetical protein